MVLRVLRELLVVVMVVAVWGVLAVTVMLPTTCVPVSWLLVAATCDGASCLMVRGRGVAAVVV